MLGSAIRISVKPCTSEDIKMIHLLKNLLNPFKVIMLLQEDRFRK